MKKKQMDIINTAKELFIKNGYKDTTIAQIAKEAKLSQVTIYKYYDSKYLLAQEVCVDIINDGYNKYFDSIKASNNSFDSLFTAIVNYKSSLIYAIHDNFYSFFLSELANSDSKIRLAYDSKKNELYEAICYLGKLHNRIDSAYSNESIFIFFDMFVEYFRNANDKTITSNLIKTEYQNLLNLIFYGLFGKK